MDNFIKYQNNFPDRFYGIRFEELKKDPQNVMKKVCKFLEIDYEPAIINENNWVDHHGKQWGNRKISSFYDSGDHKNPVGRWKRLITPEELYLCEWVGRTQMLAFNMNFEEQPISQEIIDNAIKMITSSKILNEAFKNWCDTGRGVQMYPLDPTDPSTWDERARPSASKWG